MALLFKGNYCAGCFKITLKQLKLGALCLLAGRKGGVRKVEAGGKMS